MNSADPATSAVRRGVLRRALWQLSEPREGSNVLRSLGTKRREFVPPWTIRRSKRMGRELGEHRPPPINHPLTICFSFVDLPCNELAQN
jgi:hypothetical protein